MQPSSPQAARPGRPLPVNSEASYPLSQGQRGLWYLSQIRPTSAAYHLALAVRIHGPLDVAAWRRSLGRLVDRHPCLRTSIARNGTGEPVNRVHAWRELPFEEVDASGLSEERLRAEVGRRYAEPFDLARDPLVRAHLFRRNGGGSVFLLTVHHVVFDGHSLWRLLSELRELYAAATAGRSPALAPLRHTYADFVRWQTEMLAGTEGAAHLAYWQRQLEGAPPFLQLPTDRERPAVPSGAGDTIGFELEPRLTERLDRFARSEGLPLHVPYAAAFQLLLHRYSGQRELLIGFLTSGRPQLRFARVGGFFVNPVVLRSRLERGQTFADFLRRQSGTVAAALEHHVYPFQALVENLEFERDASYGPLVQAEFNYFKMPRSARFDRLFAIDHDGGRLDFAGLEMESFGLHQEEGQHDLAFEVAEGCRAQAKYDSRLFDRATVAAMVGHYRRLLAGMVDRPDSPVSAFDLLTPAERRELLVDWNATRADDDPLATSAREAARPGRDGDAGLKRLFEDRVEAAPDAVALVADDGQLTYRRLNARANGLARRLCALGVGPEVRVGVALERSLDLVAALLAVVKAGGAYLPLDPAYPRARLDFMLRDAAVAALVTQADLAATFAGFEGARVLVDGDPQPAAGESDQNPVPDPDPHSLAYVLYTSGSTGRPKGVQIPHAALANFLRAMRERPGICRGDVVLAVTTLSFDIAALEIYLPLVAGARVVIASRDAAADGRALAAAIERHAVTLLQATPATWKLLVGSGWRGNRDLKALCGGEPLPRELAEALLPRVGSLWNMYGPTETTIWSSVRRVTSGEGAVPVGPPMRNTTFYPVDGCGLPVPARVPGELWIGGDGLARGYLGRPALTAERFVPDPFGDRAGARLYRSGDLARRTPGGELELCGRLDDQVKVRGFRIEPGEVERTLARHPGVAEAAVVAVAEARGDHRLVAFFVAGPGVRPTARELRAFLAERLPAHLIPSAFGAVEALPLTPAGKVDRRRLERTDPGAAAERATWVAPRTAAERRLAEIWGRVLGVDRVGARDRFFDLGGDSLALAEMVFAAGEVFGVELPVRAGLDHPTLRALAAAIEREAGRRGAAEAADEGTTTPTREPQAPPADVRAKPPLQDLLIALHRALIPLLARIEVAGLEHIPPSGPLIVAGNHVNWLDFPVLFGVLGRPITGLAGRPAFLVARRWRWMFHLYLRQIGLPVYVRRGEGDFETVDRLLAVLRRGGLVSLAPEGTFSRDGLTRAKTGVARLAAAGPAPVLPIVMFGQERALARWRPWRRLDVKIRIGSALEPDPETRDQVGYQRFADRVMESMAGMLPPEYRGFYSAPAADR